MTYRYLTLTWLLRISILSSTIGSIHLSSTHAHVCILSHTSWVLLFSFLGLGLKQHCKLNALQHTKTHNQANVSVSTLGTTIGPKTLPEVYQLLSVPITLTGYLTIHGHHQNMLLLQTDDSLYMYVTYGHRLLFH